MEKIFLAHPWIVILILLWTLPWKGVALWIAARRGHIGWFFVLLVVNSLAILDILYIFIFSKFGTVKNEQSEKKVRGAQQEEGPRPLESRQVRFSSEIKNRSTIV